MGISLYGDLRGYRGCGGVAFRGLYNGIYRCSWGYGYVSLTGFRWLYGGFMVLCGGYGGYMRLHDTL